MQFFRPYLLKTVCIALASIWMAALAFSSPALAKEKVTVLAAASLKNALDAANAFWAKETGNEVVVAYAASSSLARQVEAGAPADLFLSADLAWMDYLQDKGLIRQDRRTNLLGNRLVLVAPAQSATPVDIKPGFDLAALVGNGRLAMGAVDSVPAGKYGKAALEKLGVWPSVSGKVAGAESVRAALLLVSRGEASYGIVYKTDAAADPGVSIVGTFPEKTHEPIIYPMTLLAGSKNPAAAAYFDFLTSERAASFFKSQGFTFLK